MEKITTPQNDRLLDYLDGKLSGAEAAMLKKQLEASPALQRRLEELRLVHTFLAGRAEIKPEVSTSFTHGVMSNLDRLPGTVRSISPRNGLMLLGGIIISIAIGILLLASGFFDQINAPIPLGSVELPKEIEKFSIDSIPFSGKVVMKALIIINLGLAFLVLDRTILKPFFEKKHRTQSFG